MPHESTVAHEDSPEGLPEESPFAYRSRSDHVEEIAEAKRLKVRAMRTLGLTNWIKSTKFTRGFSQS